MMFLCSIRTISIIVFPTHRPWPWCCPVGVVATPHRFWTGGSWGFAGGSWNIII